MPLTDQIEALATDMRDWRREIHRHPEVAFEEVRTADLVAEQLNSFGLEVHRGMATTGVVGVLRSGGGNRAVGLRADMDALPLQELNSFDHKSQNDGKMHACGHDGHTAMLLGAAKYLAAHRGFDGTVYFIFQPAEESYGGAKFMIDEGLFEQFPMESVFGMHNMPGIEAGHFGLRVGPQMASADEFFLTVNGVGGHGAFPHLCVDPVVIAAQIITAWQSIISRAADPLASGVISVTQMQGGHATNVIPQTTELAGTTRAFLPAVRDLIEQRMGEIANGICAAFGASCEFRYERGYPATVNATDETAIAAQVATRVVGEQRVDAATAPLMGSEDFAFMLQEKPGCYVFLGNGTGSEGGCMVHNPRYDFNDEILTTGASYWVELAREVLAPAGANA